MPEEGSVNPSNEVGPMGEESPRLSTASSVSSNERAPSATPPRPPRPRPLSLVSTLSSGSGSSRDDSLAPPTSEGRAHVDTGQTDPGPGGGVGGGVGGWVHQQQRTNREPVPTATRGGSMSPSPQLSYLDRVVMEIIETERMYVTDLRMIVEDYLSHIIDQAELSIRPEQVCSLFGNIEDIYEFNSELLQSLDLCDNDPVAVARCFVMKTEDFDIYTQYCTNYPNSVAALTECMRNKALAKFFRERQATLKRSLPLGSYLLKPVQRILKYHLLLQEIAKHFDPEEEEGYEVVQEAIFTMTGVAWYINDMKRKHEHSVRLQEVQSLLLNWKGADLTTYGELVLEGTFRVTRAKNERTLFLFERMLLIAKRRHDHYVYKSHITCSTLMLIESSKDSLCFSVTHYKHPKQHTTVQARTVEEKKLWTHHIKRLILENHHAIIPQKAKEAILEMDSVYRTRYRYSPDRLKKTLSCPSDEGPRERPRSEPNDQTVKNNKAVLKHADSEGALPGGGDGGRGSDDNAKRQNQQRADDHDDVKVTAQQNNSDDEGRPDSPEHLSDNEEEEEEEEGTRAKEEEDPGGGDTPPPPPPGEDPEEDALLLDALATPRADDDRDEQAEELTNDRTDDIQDHSQPAAETPADPRGGIEPASMPSDPPSTSPRRTAPPADKAVSSPGTPESDGKTLSSAESESDGEEDKKDRSILPSSVLDQAGVIALHFSTSTRRGSVPSTGGGGGDAPGCASPRLPGSRTASTLSLAPPTSDRSQQRLNSSCSDGQESAWAAASDLSLLSPREDSLFDGGGGAGGGALRRRRDSTLSKRDQMLIGKIKCYYDTAESQDPVFSLRRRESLSYIPAGLVRSSVSRFNSIPKDPRSDIGVTTTDTSQPPETVHRGDHIDKDSLAPAPSPAAPAAELGHPDDRPPREQEDVREEVREDERSSVVEDDEDFRPSSEMIKIWRAMERDVCGTPAGEKGRERRCRELTRNPRASSTPQSPSRRNHQTPGGGERDGEEPDLSTIREEVGQRTTRPGALAASRRSCCDQEAAGILRARPTRVQQLRATAGGERRSSSRAPEPEPLDHEEEQANKSKVLHLARQYSQKIRSSRPTVVVQPHRSPAQGKMLPCVLEETDTPSGKPPTVPASPLTSSREALSSARSLAAERLLRARPPPPPPQPGPDTRSSLRSPVSPTPPPPANEGFPWPHVRELRSKYVPSRPDQTPPVGRSQSVPERMMLDGGDGAKRRSSCSSNLFQDSVSYQSHPSRGQRRSARLHRTSSLDPRLSRARPSGLEEKLHTRADAVRLPNGGQSDSDGYYVSGWASLPGGSRRLLVREKVPDSSPSGGAAPGVEGVAPREAGEKAAARAEGAGQEVDEDDDNASYVQIRSPTSREKMSIMAVIERCRAYQESDEYKQREEEENEEEGAGLKAEPVAVGGRGKEEGTAPDSTEQKTDDGTHSMVKNLRQKFQNLQ